MGTGGQIPVTQVHFAASECGVSSSATVRHLVCRVWRRSSGPSYTRPLDGSMRAGGGDASSRIDRRS